MNFSKVFIVCFAIALICLTGCGVEARPGWLKKIGKKFDYGWKLNRTNYYQEGWLATGNIRGIVGVTFTTSHCKKNMDFPLRTNYNLRGHRSDIILVKWNEPYQKLASCDSTGIIFVWIKYEGRWSIELINDRNTPVTHFSWSHDGRMALICYQDGFVLVGSVAGQRYWSSMLNLESTITCGIWTPDDQQVYFGTTQGQIIVMDVHGAMITQIQLCSDIGIISMAWSCEKFKMEEGEDAEPGVSNASKRSFVLAVSFQNGLIYLLKAFDDVSPSHINSGMNGALGFVMEWSNSRELLAVAGTSNESQQLLDASGAPIFLNLLKFYTETGSLLYTTQIPNSTTAVSAITWGHNDKRLFIATGTQVHIAWVSRRVASLQLLCRLQIQTSMLSESLLPKLPLPSRIKSLIGNLFAQTIRCCVPNSKSLREFVSRPPISSIRLHCTMIRHDDENNLNSGTCYTLYLEYLGGLVPLLKGKRTSKIRPEFVIFDPQIEDSPIFLPYSIDLLTGKCTFTSKINDGTNNRTDSSESDLDEGSSNGFAGLGNYLGSPRNTRKNKANGKGKSQCENKQNNHASQDTAAASAANQITATANANEIPDELAYVDTLPEEVKLVEVTSNIWGTKFKIHGLAKTVPANLGQVTYKTSLLHLQPRQMTLVITELRDDFPTGPDPSFNPNIFSEDEDEQQHSSNLMHNNNIQNILLQTSSPPTSPLLLNHNASTSSSSSPSSHPNNIAQRRLNEGCPPIAPMSPRPNRFSTRKRSTQFNNHTRQLLEKSNGSLGPLAKAESYEDDFPYDEINDIQQHQQYQAQPQQNIRPKNIETSTSRPGPSYTSLVTQYSRSSSNSSCQSRHAISPLCCEGSVPTLQSPKNAVAPSDIIFDRPPASTPGQTTLMSYSSNNDYVNNVVQVKNALMSDQSRTMNINHVNPVPLNLNLNLERIETKLRDKFANTTSMVIGKKKDIQYIDADTPCASTASTGPSKLPVITNVIGNNVINAVTVSPISVSSSSVTSVTSVKSSTTTTASITPPCSIVPIENHMRRTPTIISIAPSCLPESITRSCSVGFLDSVEIVPSDIALSQLRREAPNKRLVLVNKKPNKKTKKLLDEIKRQKLQKCCKSKSLDFCTLSQSINKQQPKQVINDNNKNSNNISDYNNNNTNNNNNDNDNNNNNVNMPKLFESSENDEDDAEDSSSDATFEKKFMSINAQIISQFLETNENDDNNNNNNNCNPKTLNTLNDNSIKNNDDKNNNNNIIETLCSKCIKNKNMPIQNVTTGSLCKHLQQKLQKNKLANLKNMNLKENSITLDNNCANSSSSNSNNNNNNNINTTNDNIKNRSNNHFLPMEKLEKLNKKLNEMKPKNKSKKSEVITSYADSPLFSRKHRFGNKYASNCLDDDSHRDSRSPILGKKSENCFGLVSRRRKKDNATDDAIEQQSNSISVSQSSIHHLEVTQVEQRTYASLHTQALTTLENIISRLRDLDEGNGKLTPPGSPHAHRQPRSSPASPAPSKKNKRNQSASPIRHLLNSPLLNRRQRRKQQTESSDEDNCTASGNNCNNSDEITNNRSQYRDLETFQKAQLRQKLKRGKIEPNGMAQQQQTIQPAPLRREFVMHNKAPMWNENSQVYQLDFGGRVTQESAKNFQIEFRGKQVMQFGRIDGNAYTLDFQYPFTALQAFAVALANVTQRLK